MKLLTLLLSTIGLASISYGKTFEELSVKNIPDSLKKNANAVIRYDHQELEITGIEKVEHNHEYAITILNKKGSEYAAISLYYNNQVKPGTIDAELLDENGTVLESLKKGQITDISGSVLSGVFHDDSRIKLANFNHQKYPYTLVVRISKTLKTTFFLPDWQPQHSEECSVEKADFNLIFPQHLNIRYKEILLPANVQHAKTEEKDQFIKLSWEVNGIKANAHQPYSKEGNYSLPTVVLAPGKFSLLEHRGDMSSWNSLGKFFYELNKERDVLPDDKKALVLKLTEGATSTRAKVERLYKYMQENTHYVANEYGISGWQTFDASNVAKTGYGDCKGLTNYLKALLKEAGIPSYAALVYAGNDYFKLEPDFPANSFNHVILCVPDATDSIWVECTSSELPAGYLGSFTRGRKVLLTSENGGFICSTPNYTEKENKTVRKAEIDLDRNNTRQTLALTNYYSGLMQDDLDRMLKTEKKEDIAKSLNGKFSFPSYEVEAFNFKYEDNSTIPAIEEQLKVKVFGITNTSGKRTFLDINWLGNPLKDISQDGPRTKPLVLPVSYTIVDTVVVNLGEQNHLESAAPEVELSFPFGKFKTEVKKEKDKFIFTRSFRIIEGTYPAEEYENYQKLYQAIQRQSRSQSFAIATSQS